MAVNNATILDKIRLKGTNDYQQRIPPTTQMGVANTVRHLFDPMNRQYMNDFVWNLVNRIGLTVMAQNEPFKNPLAVFKKENLYYGSTVQEIAVKWIKAHGYRDDAEDLLKLHRPEAAVWFYEQNRKDYYPISWNSDELRQAFTEEYGLNRFIAQIMETPRNSDNYDEMNIMLELIPWYERELGFYKVHIDKAPTDAESAKALLKELRATAGFMQFPSTQWNALNIKEIPTYATPNQMVLLTTPDVSASLDVDALAALFHVDRAEVPYRVINVPTLGIPNAVALLVSNEWFQVRDTNYTVTQFNNPQTLNDTMYLHHWGIYGVSPFTPCALFTTEAATNIPVVAQTVTDVTLTGDKTEVVPEDVVQLTPKLTASLSPANDAVKTAPDSVTYDVTAAYTGTNSATPFPLDPKGTYVDDLDRLHIQKKPWEHVGKFHITATSTYLNPNGTTQTYTSTLDITAKKPEGAEN